MMDNQDLRLELKAIDTSSLVDKVEMRLIEVFITRNLNPVMPYPRRQNLPQ